MYYNSVKYIRGDLLMKIVKLTESLSYEEMRKIIDLNYTAKEILDLAKKTIMDQKERDKLKIEDAYAILFNYEQYQNIDDFRKLKELLNAD